MSELEVVQTLAACEAVIERGLATFVDVGRALLEIRDGRLYREQYPTFEAYCKERWGWTRDYAYKTIRAAEVVGLLAPSVDHGIHPPSTERQARELAPLMRQDESAIVEVWRDLKAQYGDDVTAATVKRAVSIRMGRDAKEQRRQAAVEQNEALVQEAPHVLEATAGRRFPTIVIDPPWDWGDEGDIDQLGRARPLYATMPIAEIAALPVGDLAATDAHLYLWITNRSLPKGFALLEGWGFRYITCLTWVKPSPGVGNYFRGSTEQVLFGVRGSLGLLRRDVGTHFAAPRPGRHSGKPDLFYSMVETCSPGPWLEMFARTARPGWTAWGAEL